jgi:hypothetical protein
MTRARPLRAIEARRHLEARPGRHPVRVAHDEARAVLGEGGCLHLLNYLRGLERWASLAAGTVRLRRVPLRHHSNAFVVDTTPR